MIDCEAPAEGAFFAAAPGEGERQDTHPVAPPVILRRSGRTHLPLFWSTQKRW